MSTHVHPHDPGHSIKSEPGRRPDPDVVERHARLRTTLLREAVHAERSSELDCLREAKRLSGSPVAAALRACAHHAARTHRELPALAGEPLARPAARWLDRAVAVVRAVIIHRTLEEARSYRATLLGLRRGVDLVRMLQNVADASGQVELSGFCTTWLAEREPLVAEVAKAMSWFALHPDAAEERFSWIESLKRASTASN